MSPGIESLSKEDSSTRFTSTVHAIYPRESTQVLPKPFSTEAHISYSDEKNFPSHHHAVWTGSNYVSKGSKKISALAHKAEASQALVHGLTSEILRLREERDVAVKFAREQEEELAELRAKLKHSEEEVERLKDENLKKDMSSVSLGPASVTQEQFTALKSLLHDLEHRYMTEHERFKQQSRELKTCRQRSARYAKALRTLAASDTGQGSCSACSASLIKPSPSLDQIASIYPETSSSLSIRISPPASVPEEGYFPQPPSPHLSLQPRSLFFPAQNRSDEQVSHNTWSSELVL
mmetsp:Transcript_4587/g.7102  ORF Transcript_4587/g.7102 Transcript_4587/m.7102 type:complete len:293 (+) Transcript_4587:192-1070(+)